MNNATTPSLIIDACRSEIWAAIDSLRAAKDYGNADSLTLEAARCGDMYDWMNLREEALLMAD